MYNVHCTATIIVDCWYTIYIIFLNYTVRYFWTGYIFLRQRNNINSVNFYIFSGGKRIKFLYVRVLLILFQLHIYVLIIFEMISKFLIFNYFFLFIMIFFYTSHLYISDLVLNALNYNALSLFLKIRIFLFHLGSFIVHCSWETNFKFHFASGCLTCESFNSNKNSKFQL